MVGLEARRSAWGAARRSVSDARLGGRRTDRPGRPARGAVARLATTRVVGRSPCGSERREVKLARRRRSRDGRRRTAALCGRGARRDGRRGGQGVSQKEGGDRRESGTRTPAASGSTRVRARCGCAVPVVSRVHGRNEGRPSSSRVGGMADRRPPVQPGRAGWGAAAGARGVRGGGHGRWLARLATTMCAGRRHAHRVEAKKR